MSKIELKHIDKFYGKNHVLKDLNLTIEDGDFMTLLGPSGCGKTTTLRVVSGLEKPQNGFIYMDGKEIVNAAEAYYAPPSQRNLNLVFQSYALWPHMTVFENVSFGLKIKKIPSAEIEKMVASALDRMQIGQYAKRYPTELSGGHPDRGGHAPDTGSPCTRGCPSPVPSCRSPGCCCWMSPCPTWTPSSGWICGPS